MTPRSRSSSGAGSSSAAGSGAAGAAGRRRRFLDETQFACADGQALELGPHADTGERRLDFLRLRQRQLLLQDDARLREHRVGGFLAETNAECGTHIRRDKPVQEPPFEYDLVFE